MKSVRTALYAGPALLLAATIVPLAVSWGDLPDPLAVQIKLGGTPPTLNDGLALVRANNRRRQVTCQWLACTQSRRVRLHPTEDDLVRRRQIRQTFQALTAILPSQHLVDLPLRANDLLQADR